MTEKVENISEAINRLEKCIEGLKECNLSIPSDENKQAKRSGFQTFAMVCKALGIFVLILLVFYHVVAFVVVSLMALDVERYISFYLNVGKTLG
ncbi:hypothetical protein E3Q18_04255 [Wallemia mellicola]|uniref:Uncharacterized protein n=1 Tax=Wallemia mellicola TaxID=1708541 RepID=A0A4T0MAX0_9BASI|nr:hypothetical protein E3Q21_04138 [Wallemia mellicola]TIB83473.1 hypothetical protein E3Q20_04119 [Wallemia mellicola]TIB85578.1 hypothetical protein E3Q19_04175 [Wallemia mellicola]TIB94529.1 hypothetical protein E3Q18_04255 [Wallemia mellicola]TIC07424.1 hypothetical protein E3Q14_04268 [Wallemia mellicola]